MMLVMSIDRFVKVVRIITALLTERLTELYLLIISVSMGPSA